MKNKIITLTLMTVFSALLAGQAFAVVTPVFDEFKMVSGLHQYTEIPSYGLSETPFLYYKVSPQVTGSMFSFWLDDGSTAYSAFQIPSSGEGWVTLGNWDTIKKTGTWNVFGDYTIAATGVSCQGTDCGSTSFVVTPEPLSLALFGLGGLPLAAGLIRRKKINV